MRCPEITSQELYNCNHLHMSYMKGSKNVSNQPQKYVPHFYEAFTKQGKLKVHFYFGHGMPTVVEILRNLRKVQYTLKYTLSTQRSGSYIAQ